MTITEGKCYSEKEMADFLAEAGFADFRHAPTAADRSVITARKKEMTAFRPPESGRDGIPAVKAPAHSCHKYNTSASQPSGAKSTCKSSGVSCGISLRLSFSKPSTKFLLRVCRARIFSSTVPTVISL